MFFSLQKVIESRLLEAGTVLPEASIMKVVGLIYVFSKLNL